MAGKFTSPQKDVRRSSGVFVVVRHTDIWCMVRRVSIVSSLATTTLLFINRTTGIIPISIDGTVWVKRLVLLVALLRTYSLSCIGHRGYSEVAPK